MSKLEKAAARLNAAVEALERAAAPTAAHRAKVTELETEREELLGRLAQLEEEGRSLTTVNEDIASRLDITIGEIRAALGR